MPRANLFIVGAPKCGTTAWWHYLSQHPQVFMSKPKEPHFFSTDFPNFRWVRDSVHYESLFADATQFRVRGEASVMYLYSRVAAKAIRKYNPDAKILICLREHETFLHSYHNQLCLNLDEDDQDLESALSLEPERRVGGRIPARCREPRFLFYSEVVRFAPQMRRYFDCFPSDQVMIFRLEEWSLDPADAWRRLQQFLGLTEMNEISFKSVNAARRVRSSLLSRAYRTPSPTIHRFAQGLKILGVDTRRTIRILKRLNEPRRSKSVLKPSLEGEWKSRFQMDEYDIQALLRDRELPTQVVVQS